MATIPQVTPSHPDQLRTSAAAAAASKPAARHRAPEPANRPSFACPRCLSAQVVAEPDTDPWEWLINRLGFRHMHCRQCAHRFVWL
jgi:hypothetical protein